MNMQPPKKEAEKWMKDLKNLYTRETQHYGNLG